MQRPLLIFGILTAFAAATAARGQDAETVAQRAAKIEFFERQVRPLLAEQCQACHGAKKQESGLRLDSRAGLIKGGDGGAVVDLTSPRASRLLAAIRHADDDQRMPPAPRPRLSQPAIDALTHWLEEGAAWPADAAVDNDTSGSKATHWAYQPPRDHAVPAVENRDWPRSAIDCFILARLEDARIAPSGPADRATLIRRVTYDLIGLPPSEEEVAAFIDDERPGAFERVVDRLLESPHYGERWGRHWLDVARYADTKGYVRLAEERRFQFAYAYRDYVIRAFNEDMPFDQFIVEQLAADLLPPSADNRSLAALGFLTLGRRFTGNKHDVIDDRIDVVTRGLLGLTVTCARCHDHKYDPIPTADYYSLYGVFASSEDPAVPPSVAPRANGAAADAERRELDARLAALDDYEPKQYAALVDEFRARTADYLVEALGGRLPPQQPLPTPAGAIRQWVVERWIEAIERAAPDDPVFAPWHAFAKLKGDDFARQAAELVGNWSAPGGRGGAINGRVRAHFVANLPQSMADVARGYGGLFAGAHERWRQLQASTLAAGGAPLDRFADTDDEPLRAVLYGPNAPVAVTREEALWQYLYDAPINDEITKRRNAVNEQLARATHLETRAHTLVELPPAGDPRILIRGNPTRPGRQVPRQFLEVLSRHERQPFAVGTARLELARAIASRDNPLTARVIVSRVWAHHFGAGLVRTGSNFGSRGEMPSHPELLDFLAVRFMDEGWSIKKLHRAILLSSVYQQASRDVSEYRQRDPENRLLWRMNRRRLDFESLRDSLLVAAGRLDRTLGGPGVDIAAPLANRRSVYAYVDRQGLTAMLPTFDFASPDAHSADRYATTVPQQALLLMNSPLAGELARAFAARADVATIESPAERAARMVRIAFGRAATEREIELAVAFIAGDQNIDPQAPDAWALLAQALLAANEFTYVD